MIETILWILFIALLWPWGNIVGWTVTKLTTRNDITPFSYKIFLGPFAYYKWLNQERLRREIDESNSNFIR